MAAATPLAETAPPPTARFAGLFEEHRSRVFGFCLTRLRSREEAEDATQTTFLYAWRALARGVVPELESAWLLSIAKNVCLNRAATARRRVPEVAHDPASLEDSVAAPERNDDLSDLPAALAALTDHQRRALLMREWQGMSYREIAQELDLSQAAVETLIFRARRSVAARLRRPFGVASPAPWLKSLLGGGGGSAKIVAGIAVATVGVTAGTVAVRSTPTSPPRQRPAPVVEVSQARRTARQAVATPRPRPRRGVPTVHVAAAHRVARVVVPSSSAPVQTVEERTPDERTPTPGAAATAAPSEPTAPSSTPQSATVASPVQSTAAAATSTVDAVKDAVADAATSVVSTATTAVDSATTAVPPLPTVTVPGTTLP